MSDRRYRISIEHIAREAHVAVVPDAGANPEADRVFAELKNVVRTAVDGYRGICETLQSEFSKDFPDRIYYHVWKGRAFANFDHLPEEAALDAALDERAIPVPESVRELAKPIPTSSIPVRTVMPGDPVPPMGVGAEVPKTVPTAQVPVASEAKPDLAATDQCRMEIFSVRCRNVVEILDEIVRHNNVPAGYGEFLKDLRARCEMAQFRWAQCDGGAK